MFTLWLIILIKSSYYTTTIATDNSLFLQTENANTETTNRNYEPLLLQKRGYRDLDSVDESVSNSISEASLSQEENDERNGQNDITTSKIAPLVLQPNVANAVNAPDGGLLVPLVIPAITTASNINLINTNDTINSLLISDLNLTTTTTDTDPNMLSGETENNNIDMDVAEDIVFRPLFRYRQEQREEFRSRQKARYYQPYLYTYNRYY